MLLGSLCDSRMYAVAEGMPHFCVKALVVSLKSVFFPAYMKPPGYGTFKHSYMRQEVMIQTYASFISLLLEFASLELPIEALIH